MKPRYLLVTILIIAAFALAACGSTALSGTLGAAPATSQNSAPSSAPANPAPQAAAPQAAAPQAAAPQASAPAQAAGSVSDLEKTVEQIYQQVNPSVVAIDVVESSTGLQGLPSGHPNVAPQVQQALGSGFIWDTAGHIVTNNHVVDGATKVSVTLYDGTIVPATVVGTDPDSDLAVIKVDLPAAQLQPVKLADSTQVKVGQLAVAIGNPFGNQNTMTVGFISALARSLPVDSTNLQGGTYNIPDVIQTDAPINPGNSGGVLVDDQGQVVGVTSAIDSPVRASSGVGFVIPSVIVQKVVPALIKSGHYDHAWVGISGSTLIPDVATAMKLQSDQRGVLVDQVTPGSPAEKAGLQGSNGQTSINGENVPIGGDVIVGIDNQPVKNFDDLIIYLARSTDVGQTVKLTILRNGQQQTVNLTLAARPASANTTSSTTTIPPLTNRGNNSGSPWLGIQGLDMNSDLAAAMGLAADQSGVLIDQVQSNSPAAAAGLRGGAKSTTINGQDYRVGGDVIVAIDGQNIGGMTDLLAQLQQDNVDQKVTLTILRDGKQQDVTVTLAARPTTLP